MKTMNLQTKKLRKSFNAGVSIQERSSESLVRTQLLRRKQNPHKYFTPNGKVEEFINLVGSGEKFISLFSAANGVGKTAAGCVMIAHLMYGQSGNKWFEKGKLYHNFPFPKRGRIVSDPATITDTLIPELHKWLPKDRYKSSKRGKNYEAKWTTDTGFEFDVMTYDQATKEFESATLGWAWFDEPPPEAIFKATVARMRLGGIIFITATPLMGSAWMYDHIIAYKGEASDQRGFIEADVEANCIEHGIRGRLKHEDILKMIAEYSEDDKQARIFGKFQHLIGLVFKMFNRKIHVIKPFKITKEDFVVVKALDPHPRNPDAVLYVAINRKGTKFICNEIYDKLTLKELAERMQTKDDRYRIPLEIIDPSAFVEDKHKESPELETLGAKLNDEYGFDFVKGTKDRMRADRRIQDALDYRKKGDEFLIYPEIYVFETCMRMIYEFEHYQWDEWRGTIADRKAPKEKPMDKDDHQIENLGRILLQEVAFQPLIRTTAPQAESPVKQLDPFS